MENIDIAEKALGNLLKDVTKDIQKVRTEEDAKVQIINRIFSECLGWSFTDFACENNHDNGYSDYILSVDGEASLVVEAKRIGLLGIESAVTDTVRKLIISGAALKPSFEGIKQAHSYAS